MSFLHKLPIDNQSWSNWTKNQLIPIDLNKKGRKTELYVLFVPRRGIEPLSKV